jgi:predicted ATPase
LTVFTDRCSTALVCSDAGIGKTRLAAEVAERLAAEGVTVAWAACRQDGGAPPYWPWAQLLSRLGRRDALETDDAGAPDLACFALFEAVAAALGEAAPVLLVLDDLHWADLPSLRLLDALGAHVGAAPVLVLGTYRDTEPGAAALTGIAADRRLVLRGLAAADLGGALAEATGETVAPETVAALHRRTGGNPFFAAEVVRLRRAEGPAAAAAVPVSVRAVLDRRIDRLPPGAETVLRAAAVLDPATTAGVDTVLLAGGVRGRPRPLQGDPRPRHGDMWRCGGSLRPPHGDMWRSSTSRGRLSRGRPRRRAPSSPPRSGPCRAPPPPPA